MYGWLAIFFYRHLLSQFLGGYGGLDPKSYGICLFILPGAWKIPGMPDFFDLCWEKMVDGKEDFF